MPKIICISGKSQHGKDTTACYLRFLLESFGKRVLIIHHGDLLKFICQQLFRWDGVKDEHGRHLLQYIGTDVVRAKDPSFWVGFIIKLMRLFGDNWDYVLIPDCRFPNEISEYLKCEFPLLHIRVIREFIDNRLTTNQQSHPSETALDNIAPDYIVRNNSTIEQLHAQIEPIFSQHRHFFFDIPDSSLDLWKNTGVIT